MCDGLESRNVPKEPKVVVANCTVHARRGIVEQFANFPTECTHILEQLGLVFKTDALCKQQGLDAQARLLDAIDSLSAPARALWQRCELREFNIGCDCGTEPWAFNLGLSPPLLRRLAVHDAALRLTLYPQRGP